MKFLWVAFVVRLGLRLYNKGPAPVRLRFIAKADKRLVVMRRRCRRFVYCLERLALFGYHGRLIILLIFSLMIQRTSIAVVLDILGKGILPVLFVFVDVDEFPANFLAVLELLFKYLLFKICNGLRQRELGVGNG